MDKPKVTIKAWQPLEKRKKNRYANTQAESLNNKVIEFEEIKKNKQTKQMQQESQPQQMQQNQENQPIEAKEVEIEVEPKKQQMEMRPPLIDSVFTEHVKEESVYIPKYNIEVETEPNETKKKKQSKMISWFVSSDQDTAQSNNNQSKHEHYNIPTPPRKKSKNRISMKINSQLVKTVGAGIGAIATGMLFGYVMLHYVVQPMLNQETTLTPPPADSSSMSGDNEQIMTIGDVIPEQLVYLVQAGVFSELSGAQATITNLKEAGKTGIISGQGPFHVYVGMGSDKENAERLKTVLSEQVPELYVKEYFIPEYRGQMEEETFVTFATWFNSSEPFIQALTEQSVNSLESQQSILNYEQLQKLHQQFLLQSKTITDSLDNDGLTNEKNTVQGMIEQVNYAMQAVNAYKKNPNSQYLWKIQEAMMNYRIGYKSLTK